MMRRIFATALTAAVTLVLALTTFLAPANAATTFTDTANNGFRTQITWLADAGITNGWTNADGTRSYRPYGTVNRDTMAAFLYRMAGSPAYTAPATTKFVDVKPGAAFYKEIHWLAAQGITNGWTRSDGTKVFKPTSAINRDAMAAFLYRYAGSPAYTAPAQSSFTDVRPGGAFYKEIHWMKSTGISNGWSDGTYRPVTTIKRDAMAAFLFRLNNLTATAPVATAPVAEAPTDPAPAAPVPTTGGAASTLPWGNANSKFEWRTNNTPALIPGVSIYGMDGASTTAAQVKTFKNAGAKTICSFSAGTWEDFREDASTFPWSSVGNDADNTGGVRYVDIRDIAGLTPVMSQRMDDCKAKGFDAVAPADVDIYTRATGFPVTAADQLAYNTVLADLAHAKGLTIALRNDAGQAASLANTFDFAINEGCFAAGNCGSYAAFASAGKLVLNIEYKDTANRCSTAKSMGISSVVKNTNLDAYRLACA